MGRGGEGIYEWVMDASSSPVSRYLRWDLESSSACCWVCVRVEIRPWYIVARFIRSMCRPHVQSSVCWGVLCMWVSGACLRRSGGVVGCVVYVHVFVPYGVYDCRVWCGVFW